MASSTLLYIAWPLTLGLSFMAGSINFSKESTNENSKDGNQSPKVSHRHSSSNASTNENPAATNRRTSAARARVGQDGYAESYDIKEIANISDPQKRLAKLLSMINQLGPGDFEQVVADFRKSANYKLNRELRPEYWLLLNAWAKINPEGALAYAKENTTTSFTSKTILTAWAGYAPDAAIKWVKLNHHGDKAHPYNINIIEGITSTDPERATEMLQKFPSSVQRSQALYGIVKQISKLGSEKAIAWLATIKDEKLHDLATESLINSSLAKKDPQGTIDWLNTLSAKILNNHAGSISKLRAHQGIDKATKWLSSVEGPHTYLAMNMIPIFLESDPNKTATWMKTMSGEPGYEQLVKTFIRHAQVSDPALALAHLDQIIDDAMYRDSTRDYGLSTWASRDKDAASQWMQNNNIDAATRKRILSAAASGIYGRSLRSW